MANTPTPHRWNSDAIRGALLDAESLVGQRAKSFWSGFSEFALRGNVLGVAVGLIVATAFTKLVNSLVSDILLPPISLLPFMSRNLGEQFLVMRGGPEYNPFTGYNTRAQALADGALIWTYGNFLDELLSFIGMGTALYAIAIIYGVSTRDSILEPGTVKCPYCKAPLSVKATRCGSCTSWLDGREERKTGPLLVDDT